MPLLTELEIPVPLVLQKCRAYGAEIRARSGRLPRLGYWNVRVEVVATKCSATVTKARGVYAASPPRPERAPEIPHAFASRSDLKVAFRLTNISSSDDLRSSAVKKPAKFWS